MRGPTPAGWTAHEFTDRVFESSAPRTKFQVLTRCRRRRALGAQPQPRHWPHRGQILEQTRGMS